MSFFSNSPVSSPRAVIGSLHVCVLKSSGSLFEDGSRHRIRLSVGHQSHSTQLRRHPLGASKKPITWDEQFTFDIGLPTDFLAVTCARGSTSKSSASGRGAADVQVGALTIALAHLPQATEVTKWYELKSGGQSVAVLQLRLCYSLTYSIHRRDATSSLTIVPSQPAREFLRRELLRYARTSKIAYRFIDYFLVLGCDAPFAAERPRVLERYPITDRHDFTVPDQLESFCFPAGWKVESRERRPVCFSFRLNNQTELHTDQTVAAVLCFWEKTIVPRSDADRDDSVSHSPEEQAQREASRSTSSREEDLESSSSFSSSSTIPAGASAQPRHAQPIRRPTSALRTSLSAPEFQASSPLTPSYRVMPASDFGTPPQPEKRIFLPQPVAIHQRASPSPEPASPSAHTATTATTGASASSAHGEDEMVTVYAPKCFVFLSRLSFVPIYKDMLINLYQHFASRPEEATAQMASFMQQHQQQQQHAEESPHCPVCIDPTTDAKQCSVALAAIAHHNASIAAHEQERLNFANNVEKSLQPPPMSVPSATTPATSSSNRTPAQPKSSPPPSASTFAATSISTSPTPPASTLAMVGGASAAARVHRMDISGMSSSAASKAIGSSAGHQPDISAFGSHAIPPTPIGTSSPRFLSPLPEVAPPMLDLTVVTEPQSPRVEVTVAPTPVAPPPPTPFAPYAQTSPSRFSGESTPAVFCQPACCTCSCCTIRVDCRGLTFEQYIIYLVDEVPLPLPGATSVEVLVCCKRYLLKLPASELDFPQLEFRLSQMQLESPLRSVTFAAHPSTVLPQSQLGLFEILDLEAVLLILRCILCEMKMIFHSSSISLLHTVTESLLHLCFPFQWSHIYIPLLPASLYGMLEAPVSFLVGIESAGLPRVEEMLGVAQGRNASQANQNAELESRHLRAGAVDSPEHHLHHQSTRGGGGGHGSDGPAPAHDLSNFAFIDIDRGIVDLSVPPPPFPPTAQRSLIRNIRTLMRPQVFQHDQVPEMSTEERLGERAERIRKQDELASMPTHIGASYHMHFHPTAGEPAHHDAPVVLPPIHSPLFAARTLSPEVDPSSAASDGSASPVASASPPTSAQLMDSATPDTPMPPSALTRQKPSNPFVTSTLPTLPAAFTSSSSSVHSSLPLVHDRSIRIEFLQFLASLIANYRDYLFFVSGATPVFDTPSFLSLKGRSESLPFLSRFLETQVFRDFLDRHVEFPSYLQDYLLYINSHTERAEADEAAGAGAEDGGRSDGGEADRAADAIHVDITNAEATITTPARPRIYTVPLPAVLEPPAFSSLISTQTLHYFRLLSQHGRTIPTLGPSSAAAHFRHPTLFATKGWAAHVPILGLLSPGAVAPALPTKLRSSRVSVIHNAAVPTSTAAAAAAAGVASKSSGTPLGSPVSPIRTRSAHAIFPPPRTFALASCADEGIALGKNPSTLNHTLLFSKMYDGISSSLSEHASAATSRVNSPTHEAQDLLMRKTGFGLLPVEMNAFQGASVGSPSSAGITTSIFQSAFAAFGPAASPMETVSTNSLGSMMAANSAATAAAGAQAATAPSALSAASSRTPSARASPPLSASLLSVSVPEHSAGSTQNGSARSSGGRPSIDTNAPASSSFSSSISASSRHPSHPSSKRRQMSLNLLSKSDFERRKPRESSRLGMVVNCLVGGGRGHVDLGELSAVGELLALPEWRTNFVGFFTRDLGLDRDNAPHRQLPTSAFLSMSLLFNIALEECNTDVDYLTALSLLHISGKLYNFPGVEVVEPASGGPSHPASASVTPKPSVEREYLRSVLKRQQVWKDPSFWTVAYRLDIQHKLDHPSAPVTPSSHAHTPTSATPTADQPPPCEDREATIFELCAGLIYLQLSLGVDEELVRQTVADSCVEFRLGVQKRAILKVLVSNIKRTTQGTAGFEAYTPVTQRRGPTASPNGGTGSLTLQYPAQDDQ